jgi:cytochrome c oxidase subunit IV
VTDSEAQGGGTAGATGTAVEPAGDRGVMEWEAGEVDHRLPGEVHAHPSPFQYVLIGVVLVVVTALEVGLYYLEDDLADGLIVVLLLVLALMKFVLVASWYMHLKTDKRIFRRFFVIGIVGSIALYVIVLATLHAF